MKEYIREWLVEAGACRVGFARAGKVDPAVMEYYRRWLEKGYAGALGYMHNHMALREDPRLLLEGAATVVSIAWNYRPALLRGIEGMKIARYAYCEDYHRVVRRLMKPLVRELKERGVKSRICVDSAPVMERYWAQRAGVGWVCANKTLVVEGTGTYVFLSELLLDVALKPDTPSAGECPGCGQCVCPARDEEGMIDCRVCRSALTVETPGGLEGGLYAAGCDDCQEQCPYNIMYTPTAQGDFSTLPEVLFLTRERAGGMTHEEFDRDFGRSSLKRMGLDGLKKNLNL